MNTRVPTAAAAVALCLVLPLNVQGQDIRLGIGAGVVVDGPDLRHPALRPHVAADASIYPLDQVAIRADGLLGAGPSSTVIVGAGLGAVFEFRENATKPYVGAGLGYTRTRLSETMPLAHDLGLNFVAGLEAPVGGNTWFLEIKNRVFGNVFRTGVTDTMLLISVGRRW